MGTLYLVRHGQASFGAEHYDQLSALGQQQSLRLGEYFRHQDLTFEAVLTGTLRRQQQTYAGICVGMDASFAAGPSQGETAPSGGSAVRNATSAGAPPAAAPGRPKQGCAPSGGSAVREATSVGATLLWPGLDEYDSAAVIATVQTHPLEKPDTPERYRRHFRLLRDGLTQWMNGVVSPKGMPSYREFQHGVTSALDHVRKNCSGNVLIVSSGGPIATAVGHVLGIRPETTIELNLRIRNSAITEFAFNPKRHTLLSYNTLPHLAHADHANWITYA